MKKIIKKVGNSLGIYFTSEDCKIFGLGEKDVIDVKISPTNINWEELNKRVDDEIEKDVKNGRT